MIYYSSVKTKAQIKKILQDDSEKSLLLEAAYHHDDPHAQFILGLAYQSGEYGAPKIQTESVKWLQKSADQGHADAQYHLGLMNYFPGRHEPQNLEAFKWFQKSADQGHAIAQHELGSMYLCGIGTQQNLPESFQWFQKAANQGSKGSQYNLSEMYANGSVVPKDNVEALRWLTLAYNADDSRLKVVESQMTSEEKNKAMKMAFEFVKQCHYKMFEQ